MGIYNKYPPEVHDFVRENCTKHRDAELAEMCNEQFGTAFTKSKMKAFRGNYSYKNGLGNLSKEEYRKVQTKFPQGMYEFVRDNSYGVPSAELAEIVNERFGTDINAVNMKAYCQRNGINRGISGWFQKGHVPANKGKKASEYVTPEALERSRRTQFKKGNIPQNYVPVGTITIVRGDKLIKISDTGEQWGRWKYLSRYTWEQHNGPIPEGMCVAFKDGDSLNCDISNLILMTRGEIATMNKKGFRADIPEVTEAGLNVVRLMKTAKERRKAKEEEERW